ncbi:hypothetical protein sscle_05g044930 [Sclerotinia sclerotiorum 1980 UF-70]|nr:hypothetical protein sscle_05g044930 [Sclerotinia sclerotiorum 1980 UF-70]
MLIIEGLAGYEGSGGTGLSPPGAGLARSGTMANHGFALKKFVFIICNDSTPPPCYARQPMCLRSLVLTWEEGYSPFGASPVNKPQKAKIVILVEKATLVQLAMPIWTDKLP